MSHLPGCPKEADPRNETCDCARLREKLTNPVVDKFHRLTTRMTKITVKLESFVNGIPALDFAREMEFAGEALQQACRIEVGDYMIQAFDMMVDRVTDPLERVKILLEEARRELFRKARHPMRSSSAVSNIIEGFRLSAYAEFVEEMESVMSYEKKT